MRVIRSSSESLGRSLRQIHAIRSSTGLNAHDYVLYYVKCASLEFVQGQMHVIRFVPSTLQSLEMKHLCSRDGRCFITFEFFDDSCLRFRGCVLEMRG